MIIFLLVLIVLVLVPPLRSLLTFFAVAILAMGLFGTYFPDVVSTMAAHR